MVNMMMPSLICFDNEEWQLLRTLSLVVIFGLLCPFLAYTSRVIYMAPHEMAKGGHEMTKAYFKSKALLSEKSASSHACWTPLSKRVDHGWKCAVYLW